MNKKQKTKFFNILSILVLLSAAIGLILYALKQNINLFYTPTQLLQSKLDLNQNIRIGGYVKKHSVHYDTAGKYIYFVVTDNNNEIIVNYNGVLPNLFREGQGIVVTGKLATSHTLLANQVLAKHDEKYMPLPLAKALKQGT